MYTLLQTRAVDGDILANSERPLSISRLNQHNLYRFFFAGFSTDNSGCFVHSSIDPS